MMWLNDGFMVGWWIILMMTKQVGSWWLDVNSWVTHAKLSRPRLAWNTAWNTAALSETLEAAVGIFSSSLACSHATKKRSSQQRAGTQWWNPNWADTVTYIWLHINIKLILTIIFDLMTMLLTYDYIWDNYECLLITNYDHYIEYI